MIIGFSNINFDWFYGTSEQQNIYFEYFTSDLHKKMLKLEKEKKNFSEREIWYILRSVSSALSHLQKKGQNHSHITTDSILIVTDENDQNMTYKLANHEILSSQNDLEDGGQ